MQNNRDVKTLGAETIPLRINLLVRNVLPCYDMLFSCERPLTIEREAISWLIGWAIIKLIVSEKLDDHEFFFQCYPGWLRLQMLFLQSQVSLND